MGMYLRVILCYEEEKERLVAHEASFDLCLYAPTCRTFLTGPTVDERDGSAHRKTLDGDL